MLDALITSKTRVKMLLKFFTNGTSSAYLRGLAEEFGESTNAIRHELNNLSKAGYLVSSEEGRTIQYRANTSHPLYKELRSVVHKYLGLDTIVEKIVVKLGDVKAAYIAGDYAEGKDTGTIEVVLVGRVNEDYLRQLVARAKTLIHRNIRVATLGELEFAAQRPSLGRLLLVWGEE